MAAIHNSTVLDETHLSPEDVVNIASKGKQPSDKSEGSLTTTIIIPPPSKAPVMPDQARTMSRSSGMTSFTSVSSGSSDNCFSPPQSPGASFSDGGSFSVPSSPAFYRHRTSSSKPGRLGRAGSSFGFPSNASVSEDPSAPSSPSPFRVPSVAEQTFDLPAPSPRAHLWQQIRRDSRAHSLSQPPGAVTLEDGKLRLWRDSFHLDRSLGGHLPRPTSSSDEDDQVGPLVKASAGKRLVDQLEKAAEAQQITAEDEAILEPEEQAPVPGSRPHEAEIPLTSTYPMVQAVAKVRPENSNPELRRRGRTKILIQKHAMQAFQISLNGFLIFATWFWTHYYYILLPLITAPVALNVIMIGSLLVRLAYNKLFPEKVITPTKPESLVFLVPCYNETEAELRRSLDSLVTQVDVEQHTRAILIVCDGKVRGPGMEKTTADYLLEDILTDHTERTSIPAAYTAWDQQAMDVVIQRGTYANSLPYYCVIKQQNQGKRDSLLLARSFLYKFNARHNPLETIFSPTLFASMAKFLESAHFDSVDHLIGMDADTVFDARCTTELLQQSRYANTVGVCGYVAVDFKAAPWSPWRLYQSAEYTIAQALRRLHQSAVTHKVSCLPGCCQLLRVCEETCGDDVLMTRFGFCPSVVDGLLKHIRATASEDRNHVCLMLSARPRAQTRQALRAAAYTDVPVSWSVFLSQRRRWTLGATANDLYLFTAGGVQWFERILAGVNVLTWTINPFIFASIASFIFAITVVPAWIILCFVAVMVIPIVYYLLIPTWLCTTWRERAQFYAGLALYVLGGPFIGIAVLLYASWNMDSFGWGKTRKVVSEEPEKTIESIV